MRHLIGLFSSSLRTSRIATWQLNKAEHLREKGCGSWIYVQLALAEVADACPARCKACCAV